MDYRFTARANRNHIKRDLIENMICMLCEMKTWPIEKLLDSDAVNERKEEFFPREEYGDYSVVCENCHQELLEYFMYK